MTLRQKQAIVRKLAAAFHVKPPQVVHASSGWGEGLCCCHEKTIEVWRKAPRSNDERVLLHEFSHYLQHLRYGCPFARSITDHDKEFQQVLREVLIMYYPKTPEGRRMAEMIEEQERYSCDQAQRDREEVRAAGEDI